uniref:hypothetical protein n=1 Tax=Microbacterium azadirachtae TaxID=582680 RepID=UPI0015870E4F|nr:hypothetical protein [Microbacterium azadirachtae]
MFVLNVSDVRLRSIFAFLLLFWLVVGLFAIFGRGMLIRRKSAKLRKEHPEAAIIAFSEGRVKHRGGDYFASLESGALIFEPSELQVCSFTPDPTRPVKLVATHAFTDIEKAEACSAIRALVYPSIQVHTKSGDVIEVNPVRQKDPAWTLGATWSELRAVARRVQEVSGVEVEGL